MIYKNHPEYRREKTKSHKRRWYFHKDARDPRAYGKLVRYARLAKLADKAA